MAPQGRDFSWVSWLGLLAVVALGWGVFNHGELQPRRLASDVEGQAATLLTQAGFGWARLDIHGKVGELQGEAPSEDARSAAYDTARRLLLPYMGVPGVFSELDNRLKVKAAPVLPPRPQRQRRWPWLLWAWPSPHPRCRPFLLPPPRTVLTP